MQDFDIERNERAQRNNDLRFKIGGEEFWIHTGVRPEVVARWGDAGSVTEEGTLGVFDETILAFIRDEHGAHARWNALRARVADPITLEDIEEIIKWCFARTAGRPFVPSSASTDGQKPTDTSSTDGSSSQETPAASAA